MKCVRGASRYTSASWKFAFNGQITHLFDSENGKWTVLQPAGRQFQGTLDSDRDVTNFLTKVSNGDCKSWMEYIMNHWDEKLETTGNSEDWMEWCSLETGLTYPTQCVCL